MTVGRLTYLVCAMLLAAAGVGAAVPPGSSGRAARPSVAGQGPAGSWDDRFNPPGTDGEVLAIATIGSDLYIGGRFTHIGNISARHIARWDGRRWYPLEQGGTEGVDGPVAVLLADGDSLFVGGSFDRVGSVDAGNIAVWHPVQRSWSTFAQGVGGADGGCVAAMLRRGSDLYVGGLFTTASTVLANNIARWDGVRWSRLAGGVGGAVSAMALDGSHLYVGGFFATAGDQQVSNVACWDMTLGAWSALGLGVDSVVSAIAVRNNDVYIGGHFASAGGKTVENLAVWNSASRDWSPFPMKVTLPPLGPDGDGYDAAAIDAIVVDGDDLYLAGLFRFGSEADYRTTDTIRSVVRWNLETGTMERLRNSLAGLDRVAQRARVLHLSNGILYVGGVFESADRYGASNIAALRVADLRWLSLGTSINGFIQFGGVYALAVDGKQLYVGGSFTNAGASESRDVVRWDGQDWRDVGVGDGNTLPVNTDVLRSVETMLMHDGDLYVGGALDTIAGVPVKGIARWNGVQWFPVGAPDDPLALSEVFSMTMLGDQLYAIGIRIVPPVNPDPDPRDSSFYVLSRFDGERWSELARFDRFPRVLAAGGNGLYIGGRFGTVNGKPLATLVYFDAATGTLTGVGGGVDGEVFALMADEHGIWVGGQFPFAGGVEAHGLAFWDGSTWSGLDSAGFGTGTVYAIGKLDGDLVVGGQFLPENGAPANNIALWDGSRWWPLGDGTDYSVRALSTIDDDLYVGGEFWRAGSGSSYYFARWTKDVGASAPVPGVAMPGPDRPMIDGVQPNPAACAATVQLYLPHASHVSLALFDLLGRKVAVLAERDLPAGRSTVDWSADGIAGGAYFCRLVTAGGAATSRVVIGR